MRRVVSPPDPFRFRTGQQDMPVAVKLLHVLHDLIWVW